MPPPSPPPQPPVPPPSPVAAKACSCSVNSDFNEELATIPPKIATKLKKYNLFPNMGGYTSYETNKVEAT
ncbi:MAG: hypothetical protein ACJ71K_16560 [Nitrososphaeraceae archaeon]